MFLIGIEKEKIAELAEGTAVRINGWDTTLRREGDVLIFEDNDGLENRCQILMTDEDETVLKFVCASHCEEVVTETTKYFVDVREKETIRRRKRFVIEAPSDWDADVLADLDGTILLILAEDSDVQWDVEYTIGCEDDDGIVVSGPVPDDISPDIVFETNEAGCLIETATGEPATWSNP